MAKKYASLDTLRTFLDNLSNKFANLTHSHTISDISDFTVDSSLSPTSINPVQNKVLDAEFEAIANSMNALETAIDSKVDESTLSDYYTKTETDNVFAQKSQVQIVTWGDDD